MPLMLVVVGRTGTWASRHIGVVDPTDTRCRCHQPHWYLGYSSRCRLLFSLMVGGGGWYLSA